MTYFDVYVVDRLTHERVCVLSFGTKTEAGEISRYLDKVGSCDIEIVESPFFLKGKHER